MKLQKQLSKKVGTRKYFKWVVVIPLGDITRLGWEKGEEVQMKIKRSKLVLQRILGKQRY